ncbi:hypothetical protein MMC25_000639 [Agyrium rufum]|nr:hypothetical protein [Agyrium rufum]
MSTHLASGGRTRGRGRGSGSGPRLGGSSRENSDDERNKGEQMRWKRGGDRTTAPVGPSRGGLSTRVTGPNTSTARQPRGSDKGIRGRGGRGRANTTSIHNPSPYKPATAQAPLANAWKKEGWRDPTVGGDLGPWKQRMNDLYKKLKNGREKERQDAVRNGLLGDPEQQTSLANAIVVVGTCQDMCPEYERVERIVQDMVEGSEKAIPKTTDPSGNRVPYEDLMVKRFRRPAAGNGAQIPSDLRPPLVLQQTLNYLIETLIGQATSLGSVHKFVWDRTRSIRNDFSIQQPTKAHDVRIAVDCYERIVRFHILSAHWLSRSGYDSFEFDEHQEREQLNNTLLSLCYLYDDHRGKIKFPNEAEFRAYRIVFELQDQRPDLEYRTPYELGKLMEDRRIKIALEMHAAASNTLDDQGPLQPRAAFVLAQGKYAKFWNLVGSSKVSYLMACCAEMSFNQVRRVALESIAKVYRRPNPKRLEDLLLTELVGAFGFDDDDQVQKYCEEHGFMVDETERGEAFLDISSVSLGGISDTNTARKQIFSESLVEVKRHGRTIPAVINGLTVVQAREQGMIEAVDPGSIASSMDVDNNSDSLFIPENAASSNATIIPSTTPFISTPSAAVAEPPMFDPFGRPIPTTKTEVGTPPLRPPAPQPSLFPPQSLGPAPSNPFQTTSTKSASPFNTLSSPWAIPSKTAANAPIQPTFKGSISDEAPKPNTQSSILPSTVPSLQVDKEATQSIPSERSTSPTTANHTFLDSTRQTTSTTPSPAIFQFAPIIAKTSSPFTQRNISGSPIFESTKPNKGAPSIHLKKESPDPLNPNTPTASFNDQEQSPAPFQPALNSTFFSSGAPTFDTLRQPLPLTSLPPSDHETKFSPAPPLLPRNSFLKGRNQNHFIPSTNPILNGEVKATAQHSQPPLFPYISSIEHAPPIPLTRPGQEPSSIFKTQPASPSSQVQTQEVERRHREELISQLAAVLISQNGGLLEQFVEHVTGPLVLGCMTQAKKEKQDAEIANARGYLLSKKYCRRWKDITWRRILARKGKERRQRLAEGRRAFAEKANLSRQEPQSITNQISQSRRPPRRMPSPVQEPRNFFPVPQVNSTLGESILNNPHRSSSPHKRKLDDSALSDPDSSQQLPHLNGYRPHHKRSHTASGSMDSSSVISGRIGKSNTSKLPNRAEIEALQLKARSMGPVGRTDTTRTDYFRLKARGLDPLTPAVPLVPKRQSFDHKFDRGLSASTTEVLRTIMGPPQGKPSLLTGLTCTPMKTPEASTSVLKPSTATRSAVPQSNDPDSDEELFAQVNKVKAAMAEDASWMREESEAIRWSHSSSRDASESRLHQSIENARSVLDSSRSRERSTLPPTKTFVDLSVPSRTKQRLMQTYAKGLLPPNYFDPSYKESLRTRKDDGQGLQELNNRTGHLANHANQKSPIFNDHADEEEFEIGEGPFDDDYWDDAQQVREGEGPTEEFYEDEELFGEEGRDRYDSEEEEREEGDEDDEDDEDAEEDEEDEGSGYIGGFGGRSAAPSNRFAALANGYAGGTGASADDAIEL